MPSIVAGYNLPTMPVSPWVLTSPKVWM